MKIAKSLPESSHGDPRNAIASVEEIIDEARHGRMYILIDDEDRENEGDLVMPAQMATPASINFMATHGRGLICLAMGKDRIDQLGLQLMARNNGSRHETAFTISIEARDGVTTGISAADRARTIAVAIDSSKGAEHLVSPGHVFPLLARPGGVLVRAGHTEAAVDVSRLAGLNPSGVICEILKEDGTMARLPELVKFARLHNLKIGTIRDLIAYRRRYDNNLERIADTRFRSHWGGDWTAITFRNRAADAETLALVKGSLPTSEPTLVRMHVLDLFDDILGQDGNRGGLLSRSMEVVAEHGSGVVVILGRPPQLSHVFRARAGEHVPEMNELRDYGIGAQILAELGIHDMILLTNSSTTLVALEGYGINIVEERAL